jgi:hypothetical protein
VAADFPAVVLVAAAAGAGNVRLLSVMVIKKLGLNPSFLDIFYTKL